MLTLEQTEQAINEIVESLPEEIFVDLNGGVLLREDVKLHSQSRTEDLYILGEYYRDRIFGRYIVIYYGSLVKVFRHLNSARFRGELERVLKHELTHHLETRAGEHDLERQDERELLHYLARHRPEDAAH